MNKFLTNNWSIVVGFLAAIFTAGTLFAEFTSLQAELTTVHERLDKKIKVINDLEDRIIALEKQVEFDRGYKKAKDE